MFCAAAFFFVLCDGKKWENTYIFIVRGFSPVLCITMLTSFQDLTLISSFSQALKIWFGVKKTRALLPVTQMYLIFLYS